MRQVLFPIPLRFMDSLPSWWPDSIPIYGFGMMLFLAFLACTWLACRRAQRAGIAKEYIQDLAIWIFVGGILGARIAYMVFYDRGVTAENFLTRFFMIWEGGLVFYGSAVGGVFGYALAYLLVIRRHGLSTWKLADIIAPSCAVGLLLGRVGCLLNGCCYGNVVCTDCVGLSFPLSSPPRFELTMKGYQTAAGFTIQDDANGAALVGAVEPNSPAEVAGLRPGDLIVAADDQDIPSYAKLQHYMGEGWRRGKTDLALKVHRGSQTVALASYEPRTLRLHPTQVYESISMLFLLWFLLAVEPFTRRDGLLMVIFMLGYSMHRFLNEMLRSDPHPVAYNLTLSQYGSIVVFVAGLGLLVWMTRQPRRHEPQQTLAVCRV